MAEKDVLVIIPAYNEEESIRAVLEQLRQPEIARLVDVLVINDASKDRTAQIAQAEGCAVVTHIYNLGYGSGLQVGYKYALEHGYRYLIQMDADGQHDGCNVLSLYQSLRTQDADGRYPDIVIGSRFLPGSRSFPISGVKKMGVRFFRMLIWRTGHQHVQDPTSGLQGLNRKAMAYYAGYQHFDDRYPDANMILQMILLNFKVTEVPSVMYPRRSGKSMHAGLEPFWYMLRMGLSVACVLFRCKVLKLDENAGLQEEWPYEEEWSRLPAMS